MKGENAFAARFTVNLCLVDHGDLGKALVTLVLHNEGKCKDQSMPPVTKGRTNHNEEKGGGPKGLLTQHQVTLLTHSHRCPPESGVISGRSRVIPIAVAQEYQASS